MSVDFFVQEIILQIYGRTLMSLDNKVIWSEGMFLNPQHFQQQERYFQQYVDGRCSAFGGYGWGLHEIEVDAQLLKLGKVSVVKARGVFPDGTPFFFPNQDDAPAVLEITSGIHNQTVYLAVPVNRLGAVEVSGDNSARGLARYYSSEHSVRDVTQEGGETIPISIGKLRMRLLLESDDLSGYACIGVLRIVESRDDKNILLDDSFIPTVIDCNCAHRLTAFFSELTGLLHHRGESIAGRLADVRSGGTAEVSDYIMLQLINRHELLISHLAKIKALHPLTFFFELLQVLGDLSVFFSATKRPPVLPFYLHDDLQATFMPLMMALRQGLSAVYEQTAVSLNLVEKKYGIKVAQIPDITLLNSSVFILAARANIAEDVLRIRLPAQVKVGPVERIRQLVNAAMPGIPMKALPVVPRQIPFNSGFTYFELEKNSALWKELQHSGGIALHVGGEFPELEFQLWAIRQ